MVKQEEWLAGLGRQGRCKEMSIEQSLKLVRTRIEAAAKLAGRQAEEIEIIAVTKYVSTTKAMEALHAGLQHVGENRWQQAKEKWEHITEQALNNNCESPQWHFIGSLQTNKVKEIVGKFDYIHSLDRVSLAEAIQKQAAKLDTYVKCFIQVNVSGEQSKQGLHPDELMAFVDQLSQWDRIKVIGLMTMAPYEADPEHTRVVFRALKNLRDQIQEKSNGTSSIEHLSMGMSNDFEVAIEEGATFVRLGTILVGT